MNIRKRDGHLVPFEKGKIEVAINKAFLEVDGLANDKVAVTIADWIEDNLQEGAGVEDIQDNIQKKLIESGCQDVAISYIRYRHLRELIRESNTTDKTILELIDNDSDYWKYENANKNSKIVTVQRDYLAGITSTDITKRFLLPKDVVEAHEAGIIHFHDADYFAQHALTNCELVNLEDMLQNGTVINGVKIEKPHRFLTACTIATQIILAVTSSTYGGCTITLSHLAPFVRDSYNYYYKKYISWEVSEELCEEFALRDTRKEIADGVQTFNYQVNSMTNTNGQAPFLSVCMYLGETTEYKKELAWIIEEFLNQRILGFKNEQGEYITPAFPKLLYVLEEDNIQENSPYWYLTKLAAKCTAKRMVPDYISEKVMKANKINKFGVGDAFPCMGCRSFLTPWSSSGNISKAKNYIEGKGKYYGRFNQGVVTINLADVAFSSQKNETKFWEILDERLELCHKALQIRHKRLSDVTSDVAPILWQHGALARLEKGETIEKLLKDNYSTLSLGYAALYECVKYMTGFSHTKEGKPHDFAVKVMQALNDACSRWRAVENIGYSVYGTPIESTTYKFAKCLKKRFGNGIFIELDGHDRNYITNSYHIPVFEKIDFFEKLSKESEFQLLSPGGAISYGESCSLINNLAVIEEGIRFIYDNIMYAEFNTKSDYCQICGYDGEIEIIDKDGQLDWRCPNCGNEDHSKMNVARRVCGYIGTNFFNQGRTNEIKDRFVHLDNIEVDE